MEAKESEVYIVYCDHNAAQGIIASGELERISKNFGIKAEYKSGLFLIYRGSATKSKHQQAKHMLIMHVQQQLPTNPNFQWYWFNGYYWRQYDSESNQKIEEALQNNLPTALLNIDTKVYQVDLTNMIQKSSSGRFWNILRNPPPQPRYKQFDSRKPRQYPKGWAFKDNERWRNLPHDVSNRIDQEQNQGSTVFTLEYEGREYEINLEAPSMKDQSNNSYSLRRNN